METAFAPLVGDDPTFMNAPADIAAARAAGAPQAQPMNKVIPPELSSMEARLKAQGSGTSFLTTLTAILGAAKGDFRGIQQLEEQKRRTALAKSMVPEITRVNELVNSGKWEEASDHVNQLANSYGQRADYLVPYFQQMQASIQKKQEGWNNLKGVYEFYKEKVPEGSPQASTVEALRKAVEKRDQISETTLSGLLTRGAPHIQNLDGRITATDPYSLQTYTEQLPNVVSRADVDNFGGNTIAAKYGLNVGQVRDVLNNVNVEDDQGNKIGKNTEAARLIKSEYNLLQPINRDLEMAKVLALDPAMTIQLIKDNGTLNTARRYFPSGAIDTALKAHFNRLTEQQMAVVEGTMQADPRALQGRAVINLDPSSPNFLGESTDVNTVNTIRNSGGRLGIVRPEILDSEVKPARAALQSLDLIPQMLEGGKDVTTTGDRLSAGITARLSKLPYIKFPISKNVEIRQIAKTMLRAAIEQVENTANRGGSIRGGDDVEIANLKEFAAGDFITPQEMLRAVERTKLIASQILQRSLGVNIPTGQPGQTTQDVLQSKPAVKGKSPASVIAPAIPPKSGGQITRQPYDTSGNINIPPDVDADIQRRIAESVRKGERGGAVRVEVPNAPSAVTQPTALPQVPKGYSEEDEAAKAMARRQQRRR